MKIIQLMLFFILCTITISNGQNESGALAKTKENRLMSHEAKVSWDMAYEYAQQHEFTFQKEFVEFPFPDGKLILIYQTISHKKHVGNHLTFRFNKKSEMITLTDDLAYNDEEVYIKKSKKVPANESTGSRSSVCVNLVSDKEIEINKEIPESGIIEYDFGKSLKVSGSAGNYVLCHDHIASGLGVTISNK